VDDYNTDDENIPYVELELDIRDVRAIYQSITSSLDKVDDEEVGYAQRLTALEKFLSVVILEYNYKVESNDD
tara:strand:- start:6100 stop:6315 length:216 start_codon:yes stop_codon:yes gene_type:complete